MHLRKSIQCLKRQRHGFLRQLINYFDAKEQDTPKAGTGQDASATPNVGLVTVDRRLDRSARPCFLFYALNK
jgi:hypothetical protein